jgi:hypothetical protein
MSRYFLFFLVYTTGVAQRISVDINDWGGWQAPINFGEDGT